MPGNEHTTMAFTVSGTGTEKKEHVFFHPLGVGDDSDQRANEGIGQQNGRVMYIHATLSGGGSISAGEVYLVHRSQRDVVVASLERKHKVAEIAPATWTGTFIDTGFTHPPHYKDSLVLVVDPTTASGAWTIEGEVSLESA